MTQTLRKLVEAANGLMPMEVYEALHQEAQARAPKVALEIGTAHGASAIAFTLGARMSVPDFEMVTVDRLQDDVRRNEPSSRTSFGGPEDNRRIIEENFAQAEVSDVIELFVGTSDDFARSAGLPERIDALLIDADGRFDRDLLLFRKSLAEGALIVIDDVDGAPKVSRVDGVTPWLDLKHVISARLLEAFTDAGLLKLERRVDATAFCTAVNVAGWTEERISGLALSSYRDLVFTKIEGDKLIKWAMAEGSHFEEVMLGRRVMRTFGGAIRLLRKLKRRKTSA